MNRLRTYLSRFRSDEGGSIAVETVIILPILFWAYLSMFAIFDAYRQHAVNQKAAYTIGDIVSRETTPLDSAYLTGVREMLAYLTANKTGDVSVRITSVRYDANKKQYRRDWSKEKGWNSPLTNNQVKALKDDLPILPHNERVMVVETFVKYDPPFETGLMDREIHNFVFTRPRYAPRVLWQN
ncbi:MAG: TadE/TadG family type IV pilus assembly protein [Pseudomonadota bacterium]